MFRCIECEIYIVEKEGEICQACKDFDERVRKGKLTEEERFKLIEAEAEAHYQTYKNM